MTPKQAEQFLAASRELIEASRVDMTEFLAGFGTWYTGGPERYAEHYGYDPYNHIGSNPGETHT